MGNGNKRLMGPSEEPEAKRAKTAGDEEEGGRWEGETTLMTIKAIAYSL